MTTQEFNSCDKKTQAFIRKCIFRRWDSYSTMQPAVREAMLAKEKEIDEPPFIKATFRHDCKLIIPKPW